jgi:hypothetical protein
MAVDGEILPAVEFFLDISGGTPGLEAERVSAQVDRRAPVSFPRKIE